MELQGNKKMFSLQPEGVSELNVSNPEVTEGTQVRALDSTTGKVKPGVFKIPVMVGETPYNILSTYVLGKRGWKTVLTGSVSVVHEKSNVQMTEVMMWCDTPWVRVKPHHGSELILRHVEVGILVMLVP